MSTAAQTYVDISDNNPLPDLAAYSAAGHRYLMLKATEGTGYHWPQMQDIARRWHLMGADHQVGYYHWLYGTEPGWAQAAWFWSQVSQVFRPGDWMMTDFEDVSPARWVNDATHLAVVAAFDRALAPHGPVHDYAPNWYIDRMPLCTAYFKTRPVVASDYSHNPPRNPHGLNLIAHQYTDRASVAGIRGGVDANRWLTSTPPSPTAPNHPVTPADPADPTTPDDPTTGDDDMRWTCYRVKSGPTAGAVWAVAAGMTPFHMRPVEKLTLAWFGMLVNPVAGTEKLCEQVQLDRLVETTNKSRGVAA